MPNPNPPNKYLLLAGGGVVLILCAISFVYFDRLAIDYCLAVDPMLVRIFHGVTQLGDSLYPLAFGVIVYASCRYKLGRAVSEGARQRLERWKIQALFLVWAVASSGLLTDLIKFICGRARPTKLLTENLYGFYLFETSSRMTSFPSGHSNTAAAISMVLWYLWPKSWPLGLLLTGGVMLSRVVVLKHYPSDTLAGAYLALVTSVYLYRYFCKRYPRVFAKG